VKIIIDTSRLRRPLSPSESLMLQNLQQRIEADRTRPAPEIVEALDEAMGAADAEG
jgi:hypothetical protein